MDKIKNKDLFLFGQETEMDEYDQTKWSIFSDEDSKDKEPGDWVVDLSARTKDGERVEYGFYDVVIEVYKGNKRHNLRIKDLVEVRDSQFTWREINSLNSPYFLSVAACLDRWGNFGYDEIVDDEIKAGLAKNELTREGAVNLAKKLTSRNVYLESAKYDEDLKAFVISTGS